MPRTFAAALAALSLLAAAPALANEQQERMKACNAEAGDMKGADRKVFMKKCLKDKANAQQERMKTCNADAKAKNLAGAERKAFMKDCLSAK